MNLFFTLLLLGTAPITPHHVTGFLITPIAYAADFTVAPDVDFHHLTVEQISVYVKQYAGPRHVKENSMMQTILCEAPKSGKDTYDATGQSLAIQKDGTQEDSWGIAQINLPSHLDVKKAQAQDPDFSIRFMADQFAAGNADLWTCFRLLKARGKI